MTRVVLDGDVEQRHAHGATGARADFDVNALRGGVAEREAREREIRAVVFTRNDVPPVAEPLIVALLP